MNKTLVSGFVTGDYSLVGKNSAVALERGLGEAAWYKSPVPKDKMRELLERRDGPAVRDTLIWFALILFFGAAGYWLWGSGWAVIPFAIYGVLFASTSDSRWHESSHGTAFKTDWMNNTLYEVASFMVLRESTLWRWSHTRHHSDTIIVGLDPEIAVQRPVDILILILNFFNLMAAKKFFLGVFMHITGRFSAEERTYVPESARSAIVLRAWIYLFIFIGVIGLAVATRSILPLLYVGLPTFYGAWLMVIYGLTQHAGLAENVLDHRLNCRTVYMNPLNRYLYWNMNYHVEHHMFPLVPYHALPRLHELIKADSPTPYNGIAAAYREIIPTVLRQAREPGYFVKRQVPTPSAETLQSQPSGVFTSAGSLVNGWIEVCPSAAIKRADVIRFEHAQVTYAVYRSAGNSLYATDGICTHGNALLSDGMVIDHLIECPKHNGRFDIRDGSAQRAPACVAIKTYAVREEQGKILLDVNSAGGVGVAAAAPVYIFRVVSNLNVATYIKELVVELDPDSPPLAYKAGEYMQFNIPVYALRTLGGVEVQAPYAAEWTRLNVFDYSVVNPAPCRRNYSFASNPAKESQMRFNVRIATPPRGAACGAGVGSAYIFGLKAGERVSAIGPFGDFHVRPGTREMVYLGGGAGMAPLRAHLSQLFETEQSERTISYWYGARSRQELFYQEYFEGLAREHPNFSFQLALSEALPGDDWNGETGFIHDVLRREYLAAHPDPRQVDYYLCGPPAMIQAATRMLAELGVDPAQIAYDEF